MIIKQHASIEEKRRFIPSLIKKGSFRLLLGLLVILLLLFIANWIYVYSIQGNPYIKLSLIGTAEEIRAEQFHHLGFDLPGTEQQSSAFAFEGKYSIKVQGPKQSKGFFYELSNVREKDRIAAAVWMYDPNNQGGQLLLTDVSGEKIYASAQEATEQQGDWKKLHFDLELAENPTHQSLYLYCYNPKEEAVYFDNLALYRKTTSIDWKPEPVLLGINDGEFAILERKRREAMELGMLVTSDDSWAKGKIQTDRANSEKINVQLRLKGDWLDHLEGKKWSFRVKTQPDKSWKRMKVFSLQNPRNRGYMNEWVLHQLLEQEDILTPRYELINLELNGSDWGLYVYEEHFTKQLLEYKKRKEGPIVKFSETFFWEAYLKANQEGAKVDDKDRAHSLQILPFSESKTAATPILAKHFNTAQNLMYAYQYGLKPAKDIFNLEALAKYYALIDLTGGHHAIIWHNQRFYYNPINSKLEPIGFDGFGNVSETWVETPFYGFAMNKPTAEREWHQYLFSDLDFLKQYIYYLDQYSQESFIKPFLDRLDEAILGRVQYIQRSVPYYQYSNHYLYQRAANIRNALAPPTMILQSRMIDSTQIAVCNRHSTVLEVIGTSTKRKAPVLFDSSHFIYSTPIEDLPDYTHQIKIPQDAKYLVYKVIGLEEIYYAEIGKWPVPTTFSAAQELKGNLEKEHPAYYYDQKQKRVIFKKNALVERPIVIPEGHRVIIEQGSQIYIDHKAFVLSYSPVSFLGSKESPILVSSNDGTANGWIVLNAKEKSLVEYTTFSNLNTLDYKGWVQTGAVTFYQSDVDIRHSAFTKNHCEDALNIIRSKFLFDNSIVSHTFADGFDADFCEGLVSNSYFYKTGNDGIDFSTSVITIQDTQIDSAGDKGISIGEAGTATVINTNINGAHIGIASKDLSEVTIKNTQLKNCVIGFAAYQKKPEYGGAKIFVESYEVENVQNLHQILLDSYLSLDGKDVWGR